MRDNSEKKGFLSRSRRFAENNSVRTRILLTAVPILNNSLNTTSDRIKLPVVLFNIKI